jgi:DNA-binding SARP family transcriptional activator
VTELQVRVFGKLQLQVGQCRVDTFPTRRAEELLIYLLIHQKTQHSREKLVDTIWPEAGLSNGRASLSTALWRLRTVFDRLEVSPADYLQTTRDWISLEPASPLKCDFVAFEEQLKAAERTTDERHRQRSYQAAIEHYSGPFCEGIYTDWCLRERERLERLYLRAQGQLMAGFIRQRHYLEAIATGQAILENDPLREEVHRALMRCYWKMGRRAAAARQFQRCARLLQQELQILPMPETIALYGRIVEERQEELGLAAPVPFDLELRTAYSNFLDATEQLNAVLEAAETAQVEPSLFAGD